MTEALVKQEPLSMTAFAALSQPVADSRPPLLPRRPFVVEGTLTFLDWETYGAQSPGAPSDSEGLRFVLDVKRIVEQPDWRPRKPDVDPPKTVTPGEWPNIYFGKHPEMSFGLADNLRHMKALLCCIAGIAYSADADVLPVLKQLRKQSLNIPIRMTRSITRYTRNDAAIFEDAFVLL